MKILHGHDVLHYIIEHEPTREELRAHFAPDTRFYACSSDDMDVEQLLQFLTVREKIAERDGRLTADPSKMCQHE